MADIVGASSVAQTEVIEIKTTDQYHRAKRNLLALCSAIIVIAVAATSDSIKVPALGEGVTISAPIGLAFACIAACYFFSQFYVEWNTTNALNSDTLQDRPIDGIKKAILEKLQRLDESAAALEAQCEALRVIDYSLIDAQHTLKRINPETVQEVVDSLTRRLAEFELFQTVQPSSEEDARTSLNQMISGYIDASFLFLNNQIDSVKKSVEQIGPDHKKIIDATNEALSSYTGQARLTSDRLTTLSAKLGLSQSRNFVFDMMIAGLMLSAAIVATATVVAHPGWTWPCKII